MLRSALIFLELVSLFAPSPTNPDAEAERYFQHYLAECGQDEIRCVWFLDDSQQIGMVMTINLKESNVVTVRDVHHWAMQNRETRKLSRAQVAKLKRILDQLNPADETDVVDFNRSVSVAFQNAGKVNVVRHDRRQPPRSIHRLYDIGGGYLPEERESDD